jgi:hypothetical protein
VITRYGWGLLDVVEGIALTAVPGRSKPVGG